MMEVEDDGRVRTIECLRGRLLAERVASKAAKEDAEFMGNKLIMLEQQLKSEIESRNKAEKKLEFLMKRMESLKLTPVLDHFSISNSSTISSVFQESEEINLGSRTTDYLKRSNSFEKDMTDSLTSQSSGSDELESNCQTLPIGESSSSVGTAHSCKNGKDPSEEERSKAEGSRLKEVLTINDLRQSSTSDKESSKPQMIMDNVGDLVAGLGHAKEQIRSSIGKRGITFSHSVKLCSNT